ncbi:sodium/solute symporter [Pedobacter sp. BS3]|uniref:sodium:solute symporter family transporter n=1 Tax=Pedobacter sp. BS3 TaxID=2567937 RepID=UPI0011EDA483|nr:sodium/solute symporter [Pedobacter sp. BS3]TZF81876.1 sodium/solute symporter [Pedobacter sp. BS3]
MDNSAKKIITPLFRKALPLICLLIGYTCGVSAQYDPHSFKWQELKAKTWDPGQSIPGLAGHFSGISNNVLLIAGGTRFADGQTPWNGAAKIWSDKIYVLQQKGNTDYEWADSSYHMPAALSYGASVTVPDGLLCIGGTDGTNNSSKVFLLKWNPDAKTVETEYFPSLPVPLAYSAAVFLNGTVYVAGGCETGANNISTNHFLALDISGTDLSHRKWKELSSWPGPPRSMPVMCEQSNGVRNCIYLFSGLQMSEKKAGLLSDSYCYDPKTNSWRELGDIKLGNEDKRCISGAGAVKIGLDHILVFSGADNTAHRHFRDVLAAYSQANGTIKDSLRKQLNEIQAAHPGYSKDVLAYHTITDQWLKVSEFPGMAPVVAPVVQWNNAIVIAGGEIKPAVRSANIWKIIVSPRQASALGWIDYLLISIYFLVILFIGYRYKKRVKTTNDYYKAGGRVPGWASGVAIFGTLLSAITFLTTPAKTYHESWIYFLPTISSLVVAPLIVFFIIPVYFKLNVTTAYEYLEKRFNVVVRLLGSLSFLTFQSAKFGIMLLLPSLAIAAITGGDPLTCILIIGLFSTVYGALGGIEAVIWTEVLQVFVFLLGALLSIIVVVWRLDGGLAEVIALNRDFGKFHFVNWHFNFSELTVFVAISYWIGGGMVPYISDQTVIQKYLVTKDKASASRGVWVNGILIVLSSVLFFSIGSALFAYYKVFPQKLDITLPAPESIYPWFIVNELPVGIKGIVVAAIFAVAMSTVSSTMNSMSAAVITDITRFREVTAKKRLRLARNISFAFGIVGTLLAVLMFIYEVGSLWDMIRRLTGLFMGGLAGIFLLGIFTKKANAFGVIAGFVVSALVQYYISLYTATHFMVYSLSGMLSCFIAGYLFSLLIPERNNKDHVNESA